ncbi:hypothetical protein QOZ80_8AG0624650 [Eleusine coracana subsp. coracana]|nr:hypothetical protein QOZ80_8AG0624650 [Eleusine coracana subsp. coracana]
MSGVEDEGDVAALREALRQQAQTVEELRAELEEERRAASSGADEALAMILRLQAEKATERMEAEQFRRVAEERIQHDEDTLAFLKAVVFHQEMEISSLNRRLLAVHAGDTDPFSPAAVDLPWLRKLAKNGVQSRRNASLPSASLEELCSELEVAAVDGDKSIADRRPARTVSDIGEVIGKEKDWTRPGQPPRLQRSVSHRLRRSPSYSAQNGMRSARASPPPEMIAEESEKACKVNIAALEADVGQIKATMQSLQTELTKLRESTVSIGDAQSKLLTEIHSKLDCAVPPPQTVQGGGHGASPVQVKAIREEAGSSSKVPQGELLMNHFIEAMMYIA